MASTVKFTFAVDRDLLERAKVVAAKSDTSINALFNAQLRYLVETFESAEADRNANYPTLLAFSLGKLTSADVSKALGIDGEEDVFLLMVQTRQPMPRLPEAQTAAMVNNLHVLPTPRATGTQEPGH